MLPRALIRAAGVVDRTVGWDRLPRPLGLLTLAGVRERLRHENLHDTGSTVPAQSRVGPAGGDHSTRTVDGTYNDLESPAMGSVGCRFGRNVPLRHAHPEEEPGLLQPNPRDVSRELLTRDEFHPATTLNVLAAAWIQFEVHDWFSHGKGDWDTAWKLPLRDGDPWPEDPMRIPRAVRDPSWTDDGSPPTFVTEDSHWWDGSQVYGNNDRFAGALRAGEDGKLRMDPGGLPPRDMEAHLDLAGVAGNLWLGLGVLHTVFMLEHNAICDRLRAEYRTWTDDQIYDRARLINAALQAKIHTVEWTPAIIAHPTTQAAMRANWWGLAGERVKKRYGRISSNEVVSGIVGGRKDHFGVPYALTEEFTAVYRMHPLIPDEYTFRSLDDDAVMEERTFRELTALHVRDRLEAITVPNALYSFGVAHPGAIQLHNYPRFMQHLERPDGTILDLAATDILRIRERGVPRYAEFRRLFHMNPPRSFEDITPNPAWQRELRDVYEDDVDRVDLMVGLYAEPPPKGFGFSDTAFRVFALMASRRLNSDRFFTTDYTPEVYTEAGLEWIDRNTMVSVLLRHFPQLEPALRGVENAFAPWRRIGA
ncbi:MAG: hypothetical protein QOE65_1273 [Solirubrobacteraceae bacterium]|jgi:hypothetical protein|nr:hypothetical protein [Solirubrobacteraceae bacterium]